MKKEVNITPSLTLAAGYDRGYPLFGVECRCIHRFICPTRRTLVVSVHVLHAGVGFLYTPQNKPLKYLKP